MPASVPMLIGWKRRAGGVQRETKKRRIRKTTPDVVAYKKNIQNPNVLDILREFWR